MKINKCLLVKLLKKAQQQINEKRLYGFALLDLLDDIMNQLTDDYINNNKLISVKNWGRNWIRIECFIVDKLQIKL